MTNGLTRIHHWHSWSEGHGCVPTTYLVQRYLDLCIPYKPPISVPPSSVLYALYRHGSTFWEITAAPCWKSDVCATTTSVLPSMVITEWSIRFYFIFILFSSCLCVDAVLVVPSQWDLTPTNCHQQPPLITIHPLIETAQA